MQVLIVGAGVLGQVIATVLGSQGHSVLLFDRREKEAGSPPSGGHIKPSWVTGVLKKELDESLNTLDDYFGVETIECAYREKTVTLMRVDVDTVLKSWQVTEANIIAVGDGWVKTEDGIEIDGTVIVAAGIWSSELLPQFKVHGRKGISWVFEVSDSMVNLIQPWAPYKQIVRTSHGPGKVWIGDGTSIKPENWTDQREQDIFQRIHPYMPASYSNPVVRRGIRPYMENGFQQVASKLWLATGAGKSGMALAGVYANKLLEVLS